MGVREEAKLTNCPECRERVLRRDDDGALHATGPISVIVDGEEGPIGAFGYPVHEHSPVVYEDSGGDTILHELASVECPSCGAHVGELAGFPLVEIEPCIVYFEGEHETLVLAGRPPHHC